MNTSRNGLSEEMVPRQSPRYNSTGASPVTTLIQTVHTSYMSLVTHQRRDMEQLPTSELKVLRRLSQSRSMQGQGLILKLKTSSSSCIPSADALLCNSYSVEILHLLAIP